MSNQSENDYFFKKEITFSHNIGLLYSFLASVGWITFHFAILYAINKHNFIIQNAFENSILKIEYFVLIFFLGLILQELIKSIIIIFKAKVKLQHLKFEFSMSSLTPSIECKYPISVKVYKYTLLLPVLIIIQIVWLSYFFSLYEFVVYSAFWIFFSMFDIISFILIRKCDNNYLATFHTSSLGVVLYENPFNYE